MGRIVVAAEVHNVADPASGRKIDFLVDTGASHLVLPLARKEQFGAFEVEEEVEVELATQAVSVGVVCGPARIRIEGFRVVHGEVMFIEMKPEAGACEPLLGYIPLEQSSAAVDPVGHRLVPIRYLDLKRHAPCDRASPRRLSRPGRAPRVSAAQAAIGLSSAFPTRGAGNRRRRDTGRGEPRPGHPPAWTRRVVDSRT